MVYPALLPLIRTHRLPVVDWTDAPADLNRLVRFAERRYLVSARVPSHFKRSLLRSVTFEGGGEGVRLMNHVEDHCCILKTLTDFCQIEYMSLCYMSLHAKPFIQHKVAMRLQLLVTQTIGSRPLTTAMHFIGYQKPAKTEAQKKTSIFREEKHRTPATSFPPPLRLYNGKWPPPRTAKLQFLSN